MHSDPLFSQKFKKKKIITVKSGKTHSDFLTWLPHRVNEIKLSSRMSSAEGEYTESDLRGLISSFREGLQLYLTTLSSKTEITKIKSSKVEEPTKELVKISQLLFAHGTKLGIVFKPKVSINAAYKQMKETSSVFLLLISLIGQIKPEEYSTIFQVEVIESIKKVILSFVGFLNEVEGLDFNEEPDSNDTRTEGRLVSVGIIWDNCKTFEKLINEGKLGLLNRRLKDSINLIEDGISEFSEWIEDPTVVDDEDPFGLENEFSDEEKFGNDDDDNDDDKNKEVPEIDPQTLIFAETWVNKVKLVKLLVSSLSKSLPSDNSQISGEEVDDFNKQQNGIVEQIDDLLSTFFMNGSLFELKMMAKNIEKQCSEIIEFVKKINKGDEKKTKWLTIWHDRFSQ